MTGSGAASPDGKLERSAANPILANGPEPYDFDKAGARAVLRLGPND